MPPVGRAPAGAPRGLFVEAVNAEATAAVLARLAGAVQAAARADVVVGSSLKYARGIETGRTASGRLARRAGGAWMLTRAVQDVRAGLTRAVAAALTAATGDTGRLLLSLGFQVLAATLPRTPVRTGTLRRSFHVREVH